MTDKLCKLISPTRTIIGGDLQQVSPGFVLQLRHCDTHAKCFSTAGRQLSARTCSRPPPNCRCQTTVPLGNLPMISGPGTAPRSARAQALAAHQHTPVSVGGWQLVTVACASLALFPRIFTAPLPHCLIASLPHCLTASLPHCLTASLPSPLPALFATASLPFYLPLS
jgi:hypothetical protein